jgi:hypothetical protein
MKKMVLLMVMVFVLGGLMAQPTFAAPQQWYKCNLSMVGTANGLVQLVITDTGGAFTNIHVYESNTDTDANRNLAVSLTAYSMGSTAWVLTDGIAEGTFSQVVISQ